ncbi:capsid protein [Halyomorpha halys toti-like virus 1]|nr:capsid protein [Halyomorpha halys toti-like virus 1]
MYSQPSGLLLPMPEVKRIMEMDSLPNTRNSSDNKSSEKSLSRNVNTFSSLLQDLSKLMFLDEEITSHLQAWISHPLPEVGPRGTGLLAIHEVRDTIGQKGAGTYTVSTLNSVSSTYIYGLFTISDTPTLTKNTPVSARTIAVIRREVTPPHISSVDELREEFDPTMEDFNYVEGMLASNNMIFNLVTGKLMSKTEFKKYIDDAVADRLEQEGLIRQERITSGDHPNDVPTDEEPTLGKVVVTTYQPIRRVAVTSTSADEYQPEFTPSYMAFKSKLLDSNASSALMSMVKGVSARDGSSLTAIAKGMLSTHLEYREVAPIARLGCMITSIDLGVADRDNTFHKFIRRTTKYYGDDSDTINTLTYSDTDTYLQKGEIIAAPLDVVVQMLLNKTVASPPNTFSYGSVDVDWVIVPVRSNFLAGRAWVPYFMAFLNSMYWNGTININDLNNFVYEDYETTQAIYVAKVPMASSVRFDGPVSVVLCLIDSTSDSIPGNITYGDSNIPVWNGRVRVIPAKVIKIWNYFITHNERKELQACMAGAFTEICTTLCCGDSCGKGLTLAAELSFANKLGIGLKPTKIGEKLASSGYGALAISKDPTKSSAGNIDGKNGIVEGANFSLSNDTTGSSDGAKKIRGFNLISISPLGQLPTGTVELKNTITLATDDKTKKKYVHNISTVWKTNGIQATPGYYATQASSLARLGTALGFVHTTEQHYSFTSSCAIPTFLKCLSVAMGFNMSLALLRNNIEFRDWIGMNRSVNPAYDNMLNTAIKKTTLGLTTGIDVIWMWKNHPNGNELDYAEKMYTLKATDPDFLISNGVMSSGLWQWQHKLKNLKSYARVQMDNFWCEGQRDIYALDIGNIGEWKNYSLTTINVQEYTPRLVSRVVKHPTQAMTLWYEQWGHVSAADIQQMSPGPMLASNVIIVSDLNRNYSGLETNTHLATNTVMSYYTELTTAFLTASELILPDPPTMSDFLRIAKDYVIIPAAMGGIGYLTGGPVGAAAGAGGQILHQLDHDRKVAQMDKAKKEATSEVDKLVGAVQASQPTLKRLDEHIKEEMPPAEMGINL